jgi:hypothetical protein
VAAFDLVRWSTDDEATYKARHRVWGAPGPSWPPGSLIGGVELEGKD